jgi:hypothetical protein
MIRLRTDCLVFETSEGGLPWSVEEAALEFVGRTLPDADVELVRQAAVAVLHYFKHEMGLESVSVGHFCEVLSKVLRSFGLGIEAGAAAGKAKLAISVQSAGPSQGGPAVGSETVDLRRLACESGKIYELGFFLRLREVVSSQTGPGRRVIRFVGLRSCVKQLAGARRWSPRCERLSDHIVDYLRICLQETRAPGQCTMVVT